MTKDNKVKNLTLSEMKKQSKKLEGQTEHTIEVGNDNYKVKVDNVFRKTKQFSLLDDLVSFFNESTKNVKLLEVSTPYITLLLIKHFTNIDVPNDVDESLNMLDVLIDLQLLEKVLNIMPEDQVVQVYELLANTVDNMKRNLEEAEKEADELSDKIENEEVKEMLNNE